ncbi:MAG: sulfatase-like hydrolase/transferase [Bacteroidetes bacterium]|nr:sulfatase-like hydrolase/transferase [Bacteroidota bacterium]
MALKNTIRTEWGVLRYLILEYLIILGVFSAIRVAFFLFHSAFWGSIPRFDFVKAFVIGVWFDSIFVSAILIVPVLLLFSSVGRTALLFFRISRGWVTTLAITGFALALADIKYYEFFATHLDHFAFDYLDSPGEVLPMLWQQFPVVTYLVLFAAFATGFWWIRHRWLNLQPQGLPRPRFTWLTAGTFLLTASLVFLGFRGTWRSVPVQWGDAYFSDHEFANQLGLNPVFTLVSAWREQPDGPVYEPDREKLSREIMSRLHQTGDQPTGPDYPLERVITGNGTIKGKPNLVFIVLESWRADMTGSYGDPLNVTPVFDSVAATGMRFSRFYATGIRSNRGILSTTTGFPGYRGSSVMKHVTSLTHFPTIATTLKPLGWEDALFLYGGDPDFDNMRSFLRANGFNRFIGVQDFDPADYGNHWGASDRAMFRRAAVELGKLKEPFVSVLFTLTTHEPFTRPPDLVPLSRVDSLDRGYFYNLVHYSDAAMGEFFSRIREQDFYKNTLFILVADHTKKFDDPVLSHARFHIPAAIAGPVLPVSGSVITTPGGQPDLMPTVLGLMEGSFSVQSWGRDLNRVHPDSGMALWNTNDYNAVLWGNQISFLNLSTQETQVTDLNGNPITSPPGEAATYHHWNRIVTQGCLQLLRERRHASPPIRKIPQAQTPH